MTTSKQITKWYAWYPVKAQDTNKIYWFVHVWRQWVDDAYTVGDFNGYIWPVGGYIYFAKRSNQRSNQTNGS